MKKPTHRTYHTKNWPYHNPTFINLFNKFNKFN